MHFDYQHAILDPTYGTRIFRRRIRLEKRGQTIVAGLEDRIHACKLIVTHDGHNIIGMEGTWYRHPNKTCAGAPSQFAPFIGKSLTADRPTFRGYSEPRQQCTHFHDLLGLVMAHALRDEEIRQFDVAVPDMVDEQTWAEVHMNGKSMHRWKINHQGITSPVSLTDKTLATGFTRWSSEMFAGDELEAAQVLQMGIFVSWSGYLDFYAMAAKYSHQVIVPPMLAGACYALQPERLADAFPCHEVRDFTNTADEMLLFL